IPTSGCQSWKHSTPAAVLSQRTPFYPSPISHRPGPSPRAADLLDEAARLARVKLCHSGRNGRTTLSVTMHTRGFRAAFCRLLITAACLLSTNCTGVQSALAPAGREADRIASLFWWMTGTALLVWVFVVSLAVHYARHSRVEKKHRRDFWLIFGGGVLFPGVTITILLIFGLAMIPLTVERAPEGSLQIAVTGEQWWWRVRYIRPDSEDVVLAN